MTKERTYYDYKELGESLSEAHDNLTHGQVVIGRMFTVEHGSYTYRIGELISELSKLRSDIDNDFCKEIPEESIPEVEPKFPLYSVKR